MYYQESGPLNRNSATTTLALASLRQPGNKLFPAKGCLLSITNPSGSGQTITSGSLTLSDDVGGEESDIVYNLDSPSIAPGQNQIFLIDLADGYLAHPVLSVTFDGDPAAGTLAVQVYWTPGIEFTPPTTPDLVISNTANATSYAPSQAITYTIAITNAGSINAVGATVSDVIPAGLTGVAWTSVTTGGAVVTAGSTGSGNNVAATMNNPAGASVTFTVTATMPCYCSTATSVVNTATVSPTTGTPTSTVTVAIATGSTPFSVTSSADSGAGTLRAAITAVNANTNDSIHFNIAGSAPTITLASNLPAIAEPVFIDGTTQTGGVTVDGAGFAILDANAAVYMRGVALTNGAITVEAGKSLRTCDLNLPSTGITTSFNNLGTVDICGNLTIGQNIGIYNHDGSTFNVEGNLTAGDNSFIYNGASSTGGATPTDNASFTVGGNLSIGVAGFVYNFGVSPFSVVGSFTLGDGGFVFNGFSATDNATFTVGGNYTTGLSASSNPSNLTNEGTSTLTVSGNLTINGDGSALNNGISDSDAAVITVTGGLQLTDAGSEVALDGDSTLTAGSLSLPGDSSALVAGQDSSNDSIVNISGNFVIGTNGVIEGNGSSAITVNGTYTPGAGTVVLLNDTSTFNKYMVPNNAYVAEDGTTPYVAEDGSTFYVQET